MDATGDCYGASTGAFILLAQGIGDACTALAFAIGMPEKSERR
jgi:hypothetical protein